MLIFVQILFVLYGRWIRKWSRPTSSLHACPEPLQAHTQPTRSASIPSRLCSSTPSALEQPFVSLFISLFRSFFLSVFLSFFRSFFLCLSLSLYSYFVLYVFLHFVLSFFVV